MKVRKSFSIGVLLLLTLMIALVGCSSGEEASSDGEEQNGSAEVGDERITLEFAKPGFLDVSPPAEEKWMWQEYEEMTNIEIDWEEIPIDAVGERLNIIMASGDYPDALYNLGFSQDELARYGSQGIFIPLDDLIAEHAPNVQAMFDTYPEIEQALRMPDGNIYSLPYVMYSIPDASLRYYINQNWLDNLGLELPNTLDEFTDVLRAFRDEDANGNGDPDDEFGYYHTAIGQFEQQLLGSFGMGNGGLQGANQWIYKDDSGEIQTIFNDEKFRDVWRYMNMLWEEELFHPETFTEPEYGQWVADGANDRVGAFSWVGPNYIGDAIKDHYSGVHALEGPDGHQVMNWVDHPARGLSSFMITDKNEHPERTMEWVDFWYSEEGQMFGFFGKEGETYTTDADGMPTYSDEILEYEGGSQLGAFQFVDNVYGGFYPYIEPDPELVAHARGTTIEDTIMADPEDAERYLPEERWPNFNPTTEEANELDAIMTDISSYIEESRSNFATGNLDIDSPDWDNYVETLERMGADRYLEIKRDQYERYVQASDS